MLSEYAPHYESGSWKSIQEAREDVLTDADGILLEAKHASSMPGRHHLRAQISYNNEFHRIPTTVARVKPPDRFGVIVTLHDVEHIDIHQPWDKGYFTDSQGKSKLIFLRVRASDGEFTRYAITKKQFLKYADAAELVIPNSVFELDSDEPIDGLYIAGDITEGELVYDEYDWDIDAINKQQMEEMKVLKSVLLNYDLVYYPKHE